MKKQQKLHHPQPSRKSARLSSSSAAVLPATLLSEKADSRLEARTDDALTLSLHVVETPPLSISYPFHVEEDNSVRRSSRFTSNKYKSATPEKSRSKSRSQKHTALAPSELRVSPRLSSSSSAPELTLSTAGENVGSGEAGPMKRRRLSEDKSAAGRSGKKAASGSLSRGGNGNSRNELLVLPEPGSKSESRGCLSERCLRSRTVLMRVGDGGGSSIKERRLRSRVVKYAVVKPPAASEVRAVGSITKKREKGKAAAKDASAYVLVELPEEDEERNWRSSEIPKNEMLALPEKSSISSEKCLRSRTVRMQVQEERVERGASVKRASGVKWNKKYSVTPKNDSSLGESPAVLEERAVGNGSGKNCSRSIVKRREKGKAGAKDVGDYALIELPENNEEKDWRSSEIPKFEMLASPEKSSISSEKCLRSRTVRMQVQEERVERGASVKSASGVKWNKKYSVTPKKDPSLGELPAVLEERAVGNGSGKNCSRSIIKRREQGKAAAKDVGDYALIELPENDEEKDWRSSEIPKSEMLALPEKSSISSEKCLRSRTVKMERGASDVKLIKKCSVTPRTDSSLGESPNVSEKRDKQQYDNEGMGEKSLRSRKIQLKLNVDDNAVGIPDPIGERCSTESSVKSERTEKSTMYGFIGEPIPEEEAQKRWQWRYDLKSRKKSKNWKKNADEDDEIILNVESHYDKAKVGSIVLNIGDCVFVKGEGNKKHIGRIMEFFKTTEGEDYFRVQWFFRAEDTVLKDVASMNDKRRIFYSTLMNDNLLDCIISKVKIVKVPPMLCLKKNPVKSAAFYYDMEYSVEYSTFRTLVSDDISDGSLGSQLSSSSLKLIDDEPITLTPSELLPNFDAPKQELALLDLYSGCGGMSTGLCLGAKLSSVNLVTKWSVDYNGAACESLKLNHPETNARNESAEDFLDLLKQWENLCKMYISDIDRTLKCELEELPEAEGCLSPSDTEESTGEYEVSRLVDICYGNPTNRGKRGLHFKVRWKGYGPDDDTWESAAGLSNCEEGIRDFVRRGFNASILPLPGDVDVICGGPPCQGISGLNRFRNFDSPLDDERNHQIVVFMDIVEFLKPRYCLMENVVDIIRFDKGSLGRYALSRLVLMKYQARLGTIASGCYGLPQFRLRVFIWGAHPSQTLPQFPLPTHDVVVRYWPPIEFERNIVAYDEGQPRPLENAIVLGDSISDLPAVTNYETREEMAYDKPPQTEFQRCIRLSKDEMMGATTSQTDDHSSTSPILYDHRPLMLSENNYIRVTQIPRRKGANFRDLDGVVVGEDNVARRDPAVEPLMLPNGKLLIPDCVFTYEQGKSRKPFGRVWWDETVSTVVTFPHLRSQAVLHPEQDRLLTIRECARLQGFPDYYRFCGTTKERYCQIGNAVSIPVARALGYALGMAYREIIGDGPLMALPPKFSAMLPSAAE